MPNNLLNSKLFTVIAFCLFWSGLIVFNKFVLNTGTDPLLYFLYYQAIATVIICFYAFLVRKHNARAIDLKAIYKIAAAGLLIAIALYTTTFGLKLSTSINYGFVIKSGVIFGPILAFYFLKEKLSLGKIFLMTTFILGLYLLTTGGRMLIPQKGDILIFISALFFSCSDILLKKLTNNLPSSIVTSARGFAATIFLFLLILISAKSFTFNVPLGYLLFSGVMAAIAQLLVLKVISLSSVSYLSLMTMLAPVIVSFSGALFLKEPFTLWHLVGGSI
ncbi:DMT family transporter [Candidatus Gottesmanbacteria bacterium]|nr:DMT family transporter [Candidatus Gottesmanbacteria bacterium]